MARLPLSIRSLLIALYGLLLCSASAGTTSAANLLVNGGFEDGTAYINQSAGFTDTVAGWTYATADNWSGFWNGAETAWGGGTTLRSGQKCLRVFHYGPSLGYPEGWRTSDAWQEIQVLPSQDYVASAWVYIYLAPGEQIGSSFRAGVRIEELDSEGAVLNTRQSRFASASSEWRQIRISFRTNSQTTHVRFVLTNRWLLDQDGNHINFDDCELDGPAPAPQTLADVMDLPDGSVVRLGPHVVSARFDGFFYIQDPGWRAGIRVNGDAFVGDRVEVTGRMATSGGERVIAPDTVTLTGFAGPVRPLGLASRDIGRGLPPHGLLVRLTGRATAADADGAYLTLDDGSGLEVITSGATAPGEFLSVTGVLTGSAVEGRPFVRTVQIRRVDEPPAPARQSFRAAYVLDDQMKAGMNSLGQNYWWSYISETISRLGLTADRLGPSELLARLDEFSLLFLGADEEALLISRHGSAFVSALDGWIKSGGILVANRPRHLDDLMGNLPGGPEIPSAGDFAVSGEFTLNESAFTAGLRSLLHPDAPLMAVGAIRPVVANLSQPLAVRNGDAIITARKNGAGWGFYFGIDLAHTFWAIQQGRPVDRDYDGDGWLRSGDAQLIGNREPEVPYTDELLFLLQNIVSLQPLPLVGYLPPSPSGIPDALLFYGGDDERSTDIQLAAASFMGSRGLPYHINCMPGGGSFGVTPEEAAQIEAYGTELSVHFDFITGFAAGDGFTQADVQAQADLFASYFGRSAVCSVNHWTRWVGWHEPAVWMMMAGLKGDNGRFPVPLVISNPVNCIGFGFGTALPYHFWSDAASANQRIEFVEVPISGYELGYSGSSLDERQVRRALQVATHYGLIYNFFYHPVYIASYAGCRMAIDKLLDIIDERDLDIIHSTPDRVVEWWMQRSAISISGVTLSGDRLSFAVHNPGPVGFVARIPVEDLKAGEVQYTSETRDVFGRRWLMVVVPPGDTSVDIPLSQ